MTLPADAADTRAPPPRSGMTDIRRATADDAAALIDFQNRLGADEARLLVSPVDPVAGVPLAQAALAANAGDPRSVVLVAVRQADIAGLLLCRNHLHRALDGVGQIAIGVDRAHRRRGIAAALLRRAVEWAELNGMRRLQLGAIADNRAAIGLYEKAGFVAEGRLKAYARLDGRDRDLIVMARSVSLPGQDGVPASNGVGLSRVRPACDT